MMASGNSLMDANTKGIKHDPEESSSLIGWVWLEVVEVDLDDEGRSDGGDTGGKNAFIQGLHGDYIVIF